MRRPRYLNPKVRQRRRLERVWLACLSGVGVTGQGVRDTNKMSSYGWVTPKEFMRQYERDNGSAPPKIVAPPAPSEISGTSLMALYRKTEAPFSPLIDLAKKRAQQTEAEQECDGGLRIFFNRAQWTGEELAKLRERKVEVRECKRKAKKLGDTLCCPRTGEVLRKFDSKEDWEEWVKSLE